MSLINDALKQAGKTQRDRAPQAKLSTPLQPVDTLNKPASGLGVTRFIIPGVILLVLGLGTLFMFGWWRARNANEPTQVSQANQQVASSVARPEESAVTKPAPPPSSAKINTNLISRSAMTAKVEPAPVVIPAPAQPAATVQTPAPVPVPAQPVAIAPTPAPIQPAKVLAPAVVVKAVEPIPTPVPVQPTVVAKAPEPAPVAPVASPVAVVAPAVAATTPAAKFEFPNLKMQGIFYRVSNPSVLINGRTIFVGDEIENVKVVAIDRNSIRVQKGAEFKVYKLH